MFTLEISLVVKDARKKDLYRGIGRIDQEAMKKLGISAGDPIMLFGGEKNTVAIAWPAYSEDQNKGIIRIDEYTRKNVGVPIDEVVIVRPPKVSAAKIIVLEPIDMKLNVDEDFINFVKNRLMERVFVEGDTILVMMLGHAIPFKSVGARPRADCVRVTHATRFRILAAPGEFRKIGHVEKSASEIKMLLRLDWLKVVSSRIGADYYTFSIPSEDVEQDTESKIRDQASKISDEQLQPAEISVNFYSEKGDLIGTLPWLTLDYLGNVKTTYPDTPLPPDPRYLDLGHGHPATQSSIVRRCFKTGLNKCPKEINLSPNLVFVAMPFKSPFKDLYKYGIRPALEEMGLKIWKADEKISNIDIMCKICQGIQECSYVLANISDWNANVLFEMGLAYGLGKSVILIKDRKEKVPVDLKGLEYLDYEDIDELKRNILTFFKSMEKHPKIK